MNMSSLRWLSLLCLGLAGTAWGQQSYPTKPVRIVVGFAAGGSVDIVARIMAQKLAAGWGQQVLVDNRPGAGGNIAGELTAKAPPDGYTLLISSGGALGTNLSIYTKMAYDPLKDLTPIALLVTQGNVLIVNPSVPAKTLKEFTALATARPGQLNHGSGGNGSSQHMSAELFASMTGVKMVHIPYKGGAPAMTDLLGGQIDVMFQVLPEAVQAINSGRVRAIAVTGSKRSPIIPNVPTMAEAGLTGYDFEGWMGMAGPPGMAKDLVARINGDVNKALAASDVQTRLLEIALGIVGSTPEQLGTHMREQSAKMVKLAKDAGIKPVD
ncbi:MAG: Bug family tripartite tricarboxylate transporter substrate binding protein [Burkholderiales bacterium]